MYFGIGIPSIRLAIVTLLVFFSKNGIRECLKHFNWLATVKHVLFVIISCFTRCLDHLNWLEKMVEILKGYRYLEGWIVESCQLNDDGEKFKVLQIMSLKHKSSLGIQVDRWSNVGEKNKMTKMPSLEGTWWNLTCKSNDH